MKTLIILILGFVVSTHANATDRKILLSCPAENIREFEDFA
jgi:hypothetical protein